MLDYNHIFTKHLDTMASQGQVIVNPKRKVIIDGKKFSKELGQLNYQLAVQEKSKEKNKDNIDSSLVKFQQKTKKVFENNSERDTYVDNEIEINLQKASWGKMDKAFKWRFIMHYVSSQPEHMFLNYNRNDVLQELQIALLKNKLLDVKYDKTNRKLTSLNFKVYDINL